MIIHVRRRLRIFIMKKYFAEHKVTFHRQRRDFNFIILFLAGRNGYMIGIRKGDMEAKN